MKQKYKYGLIIVIAIVLFLLPNVIANPQILTYHNGYWFNDKNEEVNTAIITSYEEISTSPEWIINVISPELHYNSAISSFSNGETILIVKGSTTITLTADETITFTVQP